MKKSKDVLFLCQFFYPEYVSSATLPYDTATAISGAGFSVGALTGYPKEYNRTGHVPLRDNVNNIEIRRVKYIQMKRSNFVGRLINYFSFTLFVALHFVTIAKYRIVVVYSNPPVLPLIAALAKRVFNTKVVFVSYDVYPEMAYVTNSITKGSLVSKVMRFVNKIVYKQIDKVVALSTEMKTYLLEHRSFLSEQQVEVIPNWYADKGVASQMITKENKLYSLKEDGALIVSYFGNLGICQDLDTIVEAIRLLKEDNQIRFIFAGHGNKMDLLKDIVEKEKLQNVSIFSFLHGQDFQDALNISDCFIVSLADGLTGLAVPSKTYSYMMAGKPIIAIMGSNSDIAKELLNRNAGYSMDVGEHEKLVNAVIELKENTNKRIEMGENCREIFLEKYTTERCTQKYVDLIVRLLEE